MHHTALDLVREGMKVFDAADRQIGVVEWVKLSDEDPATPEPEIADVNPIEREEHHTLMTDLARVFRDDDLPDALHDRLLREGFIRMDAEGLFAADRYVMPDQIASVSDKGVTLKVMKAQLMKRR